MRNILHQRFSNKILKFLTHSVPHVLVWLSLAFLMISSFAEFTQSSDFQAVATGFFSAIAFVVALSSVTFMYANTKANSDKEHGALVSAGEMFLHSALIILMALLIGWFTFQANRLFSMFPWGGYLKVLLGIVLVVSQLSLVFAADNLSRGIKILERNLSKRILYQRT